jgi:hypothetical protein
VQLVEGTVVGTADTERARAPVGGMGWVDNGHGRVARDEDLELADGDPKLSHRHGSELEP